MGPGSEDLISAEWLTGVLRKSGVLERGKVSRVYGERIAQGVGLMARLGRLFVEYEGADSSAPRTMIAKFPIDSLQNLQIAHFYRFYERECAFYEHLAKDSPVRTPRCYGIERGEGFFVLLLEDLGGARLGDQVAGNTARDALTAIEAIAEHHARFWDKTGALSFLVDNHAPAFNAVLEQVYRKSLPVVLAAYAQRFTPALREMAEALANKTTAMMLRNLERPLTVLHTDLRADNLFYDLPDGAKVAVIDWQISGRGYGPFDLGYHLTQSVTSGVRREIDRSAVEVYHRALVKNGVKHYALADCWRDYREAALIGLVYPITLCGSMDLSNERARALGEVFLTRSLDAIAELNAIDQLPS